MTCSSHIERRVKNLHSFFFASFWQIYFFVVANNTGFAVATKEVSEGGGSVEKPEEQYHPNPKTVLEEHMKKVCYTVGKAVSYSFTCGITFLRPQTQALHTIMHITHLAMLHVQ